MGKQMETTLVYWDSIGNNRKEHGSYYLVIHETRTPHFWHVSILAAATEKPKSQTPSPTCRVMGT